MTPEKLLKHWKRIEPFVFTLVTLVSLTPFVYFQFFPSMDGASHLYNANIIKHLLFGDNDLFRQYFAINQEPVPNWTGHLVTALLMLVFPAHVAEKILIIALLISTPFAFRSLMKRIAPHNIIFSWMIFPFTHSMFFFFGFFNFCIALLFMIISLNAWLKFMEGPWKVRNTLWLTLLLAITYFSHIVIFGLLLLVIAVHLASAFLAESRQATPWHTPLRKYVSRSAAVLAASAIPLLLTGYFFYSRPGTRDWQYSTFGELLHNLFTVRPLVVFDPSREESFTSVLFVLIMLLLTAGILLKRFERRKYAMQADSLPPANIPSRAGGRHAGWLAASLMVMLLLYFLMPDAYGSASYTNLRIALVIFMILILLIATFRLPAWIGTGSAAFTLLISFILMWNYAPTIYEMARVARSCNDAARHVPNHAVVLPVYSMDNWFTGHFVDYLAVDKPVVMVYNYECESGYFPVVWNHATRPNFYVGNPADTSRFLNFPVYPGRDAIAVDYIFVVGNTKPMKHHFFRVLEKVLESYYQPVYHGDFCTLYERKEKGEGRRGNELKMEN
jgi:hypothetical protein